MADGGGIQSDLKLGEAFVQSTGDGQKWAIRFGSEPVDAHMTPLTNERGETREPTWYNVTADPILKHTNHNYIDFGMINDEGDFVVMKRIQALAMDKNMSMLDPMNSRLVGFVIDGKYNTFEEDDKVYADDPHHERPREFQHADVKNPDIPTSVLGPLAHLLPNWDKTNDYTHIVMEGTKMQVLSIYADMAVGNLMFNNQGHRFGMAGVINPNSNTFNAEMKEIGAAAAAHIGFEIGEHNAAGLDIGATANLLDIDVPRAATWSSEDDFYDYLDKVEQASAQQWDTIQKQGIDVELKTEIPLPRGNDGGVQP